MLDFIILLPTGESNPQTSYRFVELRWVTDMHTSCAVPIVLVSSVLLSETIEFHLFPLEMGNRMKERDSLGRLK